MRKIHIDEIIKVVKSLCMDSNYFLNEDIYSSLEYYYCNEKSDIGKDILFQLKKNADIAKEKKVPICQDTGMAVIFIEIGQEVQIIGGNLTEGINEGVRQGYEEGYLRKSIVEDPLRRNNTGDNTPAVIYYEVVSGNQVKISVAPKGFGSENMSKIFMLKPSEGIEGVKNVILQTIEASAGNACPPMIIGIGIGGTFEKAAVLAKKALIRPIDQKSRIPYIQELEEELLKRINELGIGPQGLGGSTTALGVNVEIFPTHIAGLPVAINIGCHATRHRSKTI